MLIIPYNPIWIKHFDAIKSRLATILDSLVINIEHIGSTAVPGLAAKPIIDIDIVYYEFENLENIKNRLESIGYTHKGNQGINGREVFKRTQSHIDQVLDQINHHLYVCMHNCIELQRHLLFRDYLIQHTTTREFYQKLKYELAIEAKNDRKIYAQLKDLKATYFINYSIELAQKSAMSGH